MQPITWWARRIVAVLVTAVVLSTVSLMAAWTTPRTWSTNELVTAAQLNEQIRDNMTILSTLIDDNGNIPLVNGGTGTTSTLTLKTTTGVGAAGADMIFQVGNNGATEAMRILNSGNVGIGTANPGVRLELADATGGAARFRYVGNGGYAQVETDVINSLIFKANTGTEYLRIMGTGATAGNVGIGTTSPVGKLHINVGTDQNLRVTSSTSNVTIEAFNDAVTADVPLRYSATEHHILTGGLIVGTPTGGHKGVGTANFAADIYKNNSAYTNPHGGFEFAYTGRLDRYADRMAAMGISDYRGWTLAELETYTRQNHHFPYLGDDAGNGLFGGGERLLLNVENLAVGTFELLHRLEAQERHIHDLEARLAALEQR